MPTKEAAGHDTATVPTKEAAGQAQPQSDENRWHDTHDDDRQHAEPLRVTLIARPRRRRRPGPADADPRAGGPRVQRVDDNGARIGLVATTALLLGGDHVEFDMRVGPGGWLELVETAGTVAYDAEGEAILLDRAAPGGRGGVLIWAGEPFVVAQRGERRPAAPRSISLQVPSPASGRPWSSVGPGRPGAPSDRRSRCAKPPSTTADGPVREDLDLTDPGRPPVPGAAGDARIIDTVCLLGIRAPTEPPMAAGQRFDLDGAGSLARSLTTTFAASGLSTIMTCWSDAAFAALVSAATTR